VVAESVVAECGGGECGGGVWWWIVVAECGGGGINIQVMEELIAVYY
jgi:hypothetical protein